MRVFQSFPSKLTRGSWRERRACGLKQERKCKIWYHSWTFASYFLCTFLPPSLPPSSNVSRGKLLSIARGAASKLRTILLRSLSTYVGLADSRVLLSGPSRFSPPSRFFRPPRLEGALSGRSAARLFCIFYVFYVSSVETQLSACCALCLFVRHDVF